MKLKRMMFLLSFLTILAGLFTLCTESVHAANSTVFRDGDKLKLTLDDGNGVNRVFKFDLPFTIKPDTPIRLYSNYIEIPPGDFTIDYANSTISIADSRPAPGPGSENHIEFPIATTMEGTVQSVDESTVTPLAGEPKVTQPEVETNLKEIPTPSEPEVAQPVDEPKVIEPQVTQPVVEPKVDQEVDESPEIPLSIPSGENFPGTFTINSSGTSFSVRLKLKNIQPTYTSYVMVKNADAQLIKRIQFDPETTFSYPLSNLNLSTGGYYFYIKMIDQSGNSAASVPQFVPINNNKAQQVEVFIDGKLQQYEQPATSISGSMLVPFRAVFEALGAKVKWDGATKTVTATKGDTTIKLTVGSRDAYINGKLVRLNAAPRLINGKVMVPIRFVSEALGAKVKWNIAAQSVVIFHAPPQVLTTSESEQLMEENEDASESHSNPTILKKISTTFSKSTDIVFVIDVTSSMTGTLDYVRQKVKGFVDSVPAGSQFAVVAFRDINLKADKDLEFLEFTTDKNKLKGNLNMLRPSAGGDLKESGLEAIQLAISKFPKNSNSKTIIFITDAPVHDKNTALGKARFSVDEINEQLQKNGVIFNAIVPANGLANKQMKKLVDTNEGTLYDIKDAKLNLAK
ncbi:Protease inhibitor [Paenibacillus polymyxa E681]|uniref:stalk domain-containing protein n=1 Tax=Paenibacillus polymyxa TaxID=1406 RepID=UPI0001E31926|nr:stalk domain-containing protein [Paenibacillus polymyxa]ADM71226.1 copper amine oxidase [Paenibacillus polymyxa E681]QNV58249.1 Protease inhibitor [Paenibacillus polymyxa E681]QNV63084.1 Protease inhibitor [Paenibacillus polymyxa E681]